MKLEDALPLSNLSTTNPVFLVDCETTGFWNKINPPDLTELAVWNLKDGAFFYTLVHPSKPQSMGSILISGLEPSILENAPTTEEVLTRFFVFVDVPNSILVAHNGKKFDFKLLSYWKNYFGIQTKNAITEMDSLSLFCYHSSKMPQRDQKLVLKQSEVYQHLFGSSPLYSHCAFFDVWTGSNLNLFS